MTAPESIGDALWERDSRGMAMVRDGRIVQANERLATWLGESLDDLRERRLADVLAPDGGDAEQLDAVSRAGTGAFEGRPIVRLTIDDRVVELSSIPVDADHRLVVFRDVTEERTIVRETRVDVSELQQLRRLAGSLAHDFNNLLSPILGFTDLLLGDPKLSEEQRSQLEQVRIAAERSRYLAAQLLAFGRNQVLKPRPTDLVEAATELEGLLGRVLRDDIELAVVLPGEPCTVMVDPAHLRPMLLNLATNAQDAMPDGGL